jgi:hypothetical protein
MLCLIRKPLDTHERFAEALNCRLVYALIPNETLEEMICKRAVEIASQHLGAGENLRRLANCGFNTSREIGLNIKSGRRGSDRRASPAADFARNHAGPYGSFGGVADHAHQPGLETVVPDDVAGKINLRHPVLAAYSAVPADRDTIGHRK